MVQTNFTAASFRGDTGKPKPQRKPAVDPDLVPEGTISEILAWVGEDGTRAQRARDAEYATGEARVTLTAQLEEIIAAAGPVAPTEDGTATPATSEAPAEPAKTTPDAEDKPKAKTVTKKR